MLIVISTIMDNIGGDNESADAVVFVYNGVSAVPDDITHVRVLPTVTIIPESAFDNRLYLQKVELPEGVMRNQNRK